MCPKPSAQVDWQFGGDGLAEIAEVAVGYSTVVEAAGKVVGEFFAFLDFDEARSNVDGFVVIGDGLAELAEVAVGQHPKYMALRLDS